MATKGRPKTTKQFKRYTHKVARGQEKEELRKVNPQFFKKAKEVYSLEYFLY